MRSSTRTAVIAPVLSLLCLTCGESVTETPPDSPNPGDSTGVPLIQIGDTVTGSIPGAAAFEFNGQSGDEINAFVQATGGTSDQILEFFIYDDPDQPQLVMGTTSPGAASDLECQASGRAVFPLSIRYRVTLQPSDSRPYLGPFRFWLYPINRNPETIPRSITAGDTASGESIEHVGDVDEFVFSGSEGTQYNVFLQATGGSDATRMTAVVPATGPYWSTRVGVSRGSDTTLFRQATGRFTLPSDGSYIVRVMGESDIDCAHRGPFRLFLYPINWAPEIAANEIQVGDSVLDETIEMMGDIDQFDFSLPDSTEINVLLRHTSPVIDDGLEVALTRHRTDTLLPSLFGGHTARQYSSGTFSLEPSDTYALRVFGYSREYGYDGPYQLMLYQIDRPPEHLQESVAIGDTVTGEDLDPLGDIDEFTFDGSIGQHLEILVQGTGQVWSDYGYQFLVKDLVTDSAVASGWTPVSLDSLGERSTGRFTLRRDGSYLVRVSPTNDGRQVDERGPYRFLIREQIPDPENVASTVVVGDTVRNETVDFAGDVDEFVLTGTAGDTIVVHFQTAEAFLTLEVIDINTRDILASVASFTFQQTTGSLSLPPGGQVLIRVSEKRNCGFQPETCLYMFENLGGYWFAAVKQ